MTSGEHAAWRRPADAADDDDRRRAAAPIAASRESRLSSADFRALTEREHALDIEALMRRFARQLKPIRVCAARRTRAPAAGSTCPPTIRRSVASGGTPFHLAWRDRRRVRPRLVLLIDVSRSMAPYSFFYLRLARALAPSGPTSTASSSTPASPRCREALHDPDPWRAQERLHLIAQGFGGGTRIGESLAQFNREHAPRLVHSRTAVIVLSDGYDTGDPRCCRMRWRS